MGEVKLDGYICDRCEHTWISRNLNNGFEREEKPKVCPRCKSPYWNRPRKTKNISREVGKLGERLDVQKHTSLFPPRKIEKEVVNLFPPK